MHDLDDDGLVNLVAGTVKQAERDAKHGDADAGDFLAWLRGEQEKLDAAYQRINSRIDAMNGTTPATSAPQPAHPAPSPFENMTARQLDAVGVSPLWAGKTAADMAEMERQQAHRARADRLGVDYRYLPMED